MCSFWCCILLNLTVLHGLPSKGDFSSIHNKFWFYHNCFICTMYQRKWRAWGLKTWLKRIISSHLTNTLTSADLTFAHWPGYLVDLTFAHWPGYLVAFHCQFQNTLWPNEVLMIPDQSWIHRPRMLTPSALACWYLFIIWKKTYILRLSIEN